MDALAMVRAELAHAHDWLDETIAGVTTEQLHWHPPGSANPIGAVYVHVVMDEDVLVQSEVRGEPTLASGEWAGRMGLSEPPAGGAGWGAWARSVEVDFDVFAGYVRAVYKATDSWAGSLDDAELERRVAFGEGWSAVSHVLWRVISHNHGHAGEIAVLKGLQGVRGYSL
jgi:hypothetical protein